MREERIIFFEGFAEAEAWVEEDFFFGDVGFVCGFQAAFEAVENEGQHFMLS
jgi:hypothetical protein